jgi:PAS domain S-box-containing protein
VVEAIQNFIHRGRFSTRLMIGYVLLVVATTLSAGLPATWITTSQLDAQSWAGVRNAQRATLSLLQAGRTRLDDLALLLAERPTLRTLVERGDRTALAEYIADFKQQGRVDLLLVCAGATPLAGDVSPGRCAAPPSAGFTQLDGRPALWVQRPVEGTDAAAIAIQYLDDTDVGELAATTGADLSLLDPMGNRLASSLPLAARPPWPGAAALATYTTAQGDDLRRTETIAGEPYISLAAPLINPDGTIPLFVETALPVGELRRTEARALWFLLASTGVVTLLSLLLGVVYIRWFTRPLQQLTDTAEAIAVGRLSAPVPTFQAPQEVATLARALAAGQASQLAALAERSQARDWLINLIQSLVEGVVTYDQNGRVLFFSQGAETVTGWSSAAASGRTLDELFPTPAHEGAFSRVLPAPGQRRRVEVRHRDGRLLTLAVTGAQLALPSGDGAVPGTGGQSALVVRDVTGEEALNQMHGYFLGNLTHEFQTPLSTLNASLELLLDAADELTPGDLRTLLKPAQLSLLGLQNLVNNLLASSAIESGHFSIRLRPTNLHQVIADALHMVQPLFERRGQSFALDETTAVTETPEIQADPARLTLVLVNLLTNAAKYSPSGTVIDMAVDVTADPAGDRAVEPLPARLRIAVADRGPGLPPEARDQLFSRFARFAAPEGDQPTTGIGLFVVKTTVEAHGGRAGAEDRPGGGAIFWIEIPLRPREEPYEDPARRRRPSPLRRPGVHTTPRRLRGRTRL